MIIWLMDFISDIPGHRLVTYISFRALIAMLTSFLIGVFLGRKLINIIFQLNFREISRE